MHVNITLCLYMRAGQLGVLIKPSLRLELHIMFSNCTNLKRNSNTYCINIIVSSTFFRANQLVTK